MAESISRTPSILGPAPAGEPSPRLARRPQRDAVEPVAQQLGLAERPGLAGQHEEDGLEGVLGVLVVAQELPADAQHHRPVAGHQGGERGLAGLVVPPAANRSRSCRSESPAAEPPSKSDPSCRTSDVDVMPQDPLAAQVESIDGIVRGADAPGVVSSPRACAARLIFMQSQIIRENPEKTRTR